MMSETDKICRFCKKSVSKPIRHFKYHGVRSSEAQLLIVYEDGDSLSEIEHKINKRPKISQQVYRNITNKEETFQQMLKDYERLSNTYGDFYTKPQFTNKVRNGLTCIFCKSNINYNFRHLISHGVGKTSAFLLYYYESGDSLIDVQNKIEKLNIRIRIYFKRINNKEKCFQQMLFDYTRLRDEFGVEEIERQKSNSHNIKLPIKKGIYKTCVFCGIVVMYITKHIKKHGVGQPSASLLSFYEVGDTLHDFQRKISTSGERLSNMCLSKLMSETNFLHMLLDYRITKDRLEEEQNQLKSMGNLKLPSKIKYGTCQFCGVEFEDICRHLRTHGVGHSSALLLSYYEDGVTLDDLRMKLRPDNIHMSLDSYSELVSESNFQQMLLDYNRIRNEHNQMKTMDNLKSIDSNSANTISDHSIQTIKKVKNSINKVKHKNKIKDVATPMGTRANRRIEPREDRQATVGDNSSLLPEISKCSEGEERIKTRKQRQLELEGAIQEKQVMKITEHGGNIEEEEIMSHHTKQASIITKCSVQLERCDILLQSITNVSNDVSMRRDISRELATLIRWQDSNLHGRQDAAIVGPVKTRQTGRSLDTRKGRSVSILDSLSSEYKIPRISPESENWSTDVIANMKLTNQDDSAHGSLSMCLAPYDWNQHQADTDWNETKIEPIAINIGHDRQLCSIGSVNECHTSMSNEIKLLDKMSHNLRTCLDFFLPPEWPVDKEAIHSLSLADLADFPLDNFFEKYQQGLRKMFTNCQSDTARVHDKLCSLRKDLVRALRMLKKVHNIDLFPLFVDEIDLSMNDIDC